ncbi:MAG: ABC transporter permease subunit [Pseudomonadota bacterium]
MSARARWPLYSVAAFTYALLYVPLFTLIIGAFNGSPQGGAWGGFSLRWFTALFADQRVLGAAAFSLRVAAVNATLALVLGTLAAVALERIGGFRGRAALGGLVGLPLVVPEVITGLSLVLLFVALEQAVGWPARRGGDVIAIAHATLATAYTAVLLRDRLARLDRSLEAAARDLGAHPAAAFALVTVPALAPAMFAAWILAFTLSLDDLMIASFVADADALSLPMVVFAESRSGLNPLVNALATVMIVLVASGLALSAWMRSRRAS